MLERCHQFTQNFLGLLPPEWKCCMELGALIGCPPPCCTKAAGWNGSQGFFSAAGNDNGAPLDLRIVQPRRIF